MEAKYYEKMDDRELYRQILGIVNPWHITGIDLNIDNDCVHIYLEWPHGNDGICPECATTCKIHDRREERTWRHLDTCQLKTYIHCRIPRVKCPEHKTKTMNIPWAEETSRFTAQFEAVAILFLEGSKNISKTALGLRVSWHEMSNIMKRAVRRGLARRKDETISHIGMDEKSFLKGHSYVSVITDIDGKRVLDVTVDRKKESVNALWGSLTEKQRDEVEAVSIDFWKPYITGAVEHVPNAAIVHDKFHIMKYMNEAVDKVRKSEHKHLSSQNDSVLKGTKYPWLKNKEKFTDKNENDFKALNLRQLSVGRAWNRKELLKALWDFKSEDDARKHFKKWYFSATHSRLKPIINVAKMFKRHIENIITYAKHRITNAFAEGINSVIQHIKASARGFRNFAHYRTAILFYCGKLDMSP